MVSGKITDVLLKKIHCEQFSTHSAIAQKKESFKTVQHAIAVLKDKLQHEVGRAPNSHPISLQAFKSERAAQNVLLVKKLTMQAGRITASLDECTLKLVNLRKKHNLIEEIDTRAKTRDQSIKEAEHSEEFMQCASFQIIRNSSELKSANARSSERPSSQQVTPVLETIDEKTVQVCIQNRAGNDVTLNAAIDALRKLSVHISSGPRETALLQENQSILIEALQKERFRLGKLSIKEFKEEDAA